MRKCELGVLQIMKAGSIMDRIIMHVDVNSAYLSWEAIDRLQHGAETDLRTLAAVVGGNEESRRGIVLAKSLSAKAFGIKTGETLHAARQKCPGLVTVPPRYELYMRCSRALRELLEGYSDAVQPFSVDEYFVDFTGASRLKRDPVAVADEIRQRCSQELGFTVNVGVSTSKLLAKMGGDLKKPDQTITLYPEEIPVKLWPLPVEELYMCGPSTAPKLREMGIRTIGDLANTDISVLRYRLKHFGQVLWNYANGVEGSAVQPEAPVVKGIGNSTTTARNVEDLAHADMVLLSLAESVGSRLRAGGFCTRLVTVSIRNTEFVGASRQHKLGYATDSTRAIYEEARALFRQLWDGAPLRHLGIRTSELVPAEGVQYTFFDPQVSRTQALDQAVDRLRSRFGKGAVQRGVFLHSGVRPMTGGVGEDGYQMMSSQL